MAEEYNVKSQNTNNTWQDVVARIDKGFQLQEISNRELSKEEIIKFNDAIIIAPDYQREYRSTVTDESSLIESALLGIPIPPIYLASTKLNGVQTLNVVDGQHRLRAFYRYFNNQFKLQNLKIKRELNNKNFDELDFESTYKIQTNDIIFIIFRDFPGKEFELEIFNRYNKGTKPLTPQEIRHAVYSSGANDFINNFCKELIKDSTSVLSQAYGVSTDRFQKKSLQENLFVILSILNLGVIQQIPIEDGNTKQALKSPEFADNYMQIISENEKNGTYNYDEAYKQSKSQLDEFNSFIFHLTKFVKYPFSKEIYGVSKRGNKFQVSIAMILAAIYKKLKENEFDFTQMTDDAKSKLFISQLSNEIENSYLEDPEYRASTTNPIEINKLVVKFEPKI